MVEGIPAKRIAIAFSALASIGGWVYSGLPGKEPSDKLLYLQHLVLLFLPEFTILAIAVLVSSLLFVFWPSLSSSEFGKWLFREQRVLGLARLRGGLLATLMMLSLLTLTVFASLAYSWTRNTYVLFRDEKIHSLIRREIYIRALWADWRGDLFESITLRERFASLFPSRAAENRIEDGIAATRQRIAFAEATAKSADDMSTRTGTSVDTAMSALLAYATFPAKAEYRENLLRQVRRLREIEALVGNSKSTCAAGEIPDERQLAVALTAIGFPQGSEVRSLLGRYASAGLTVCDLIREGNLVVEAKEIERRLGVIDARYKARTLASFLRFRVGLETSDLPFDSEFHEAKFRLMYSLLRGRKGSSADTTEEAFPGSEAPPEFHSSANELTMPPELGSTRRQLHGSALDESDRGTDRGARRRARTARGGPSGEEVVAESPALPERVEQPILLAAVERPRGIRFCWRQGVRFSEDVLIPSDGGAVSLERCGSTLSNVVSLESPEDLALASELRALLEAHVEVLSVDGRSDEAATRRAVCFAVGYLDLIDSAKEVSGQCEMEVRILCAGRRVAQMIGTTDKYPLKCESLIGSRRPAGPQLDRGVSIEAVRLDEDIVSSIGSRVIVVTWVGRASRVGSAVLECTIRTSGGDAVPCGRLPVQLPSGSRDFTVPDRVPVGRHRLEFTWRASGAVAVREIDFVIVDPMTSPVSR